MWQPEPGWLAAARRHRHRPPSASGAASSATGRSSIKRLAAPGRARPRRAERPPALRLLAARGRRGHLRDRRRRPPGCAARSTRRSRRTSTGITIVQDWVEDAAEQRAVRRARHGPVRRRRPRRRAAGSPATSCADRMDRVERRGGWTTLARTTVADVADHLWQRREHHPRRARRADPGAAARRPGPGQPARAGGRRGGRDRLGHARHGPVGADLGYYSLSAREEFEPLLDAYLIGLPDGLATRDEVALGARVTAVYTVLSRAEWALARVAGGRARSPRSTATRPWRRTCGRCSGSSRRSRRCSWLSRASQRRWRQNVSQASRLPCS